MSRLFSFSATCRPAIVFLSCLILSTTSSVVVAGDKKAAAEELKKAFSFEKGDLEVLDGTDDIVKQFSKLPEKK